MTIKGLEREYHKTSDNKIHENKEKEPNHKAKENHQTTMRETERRRQQQRNTFKNK